MAFTSGDFVVVRSSKKKKYTGNNHDNRIVGMFQLLSKFAVPCASPALQGYRSLGGLFAKPRLPLVLVKSCRRQFRGRSRAK